MSQRADHHLVHPEINTGCKTPRDAWEQVKSKKREMQSCKTYQAALNLQAAFRHYMGTLRYELVEAA